MSGKVDDVADSIFESVKADIDARLRGVEEKTMRYAGVYKAGAEYPVGSAVTPDGGFWLALQKTQTRPGISKDWKLVVKEHAFR